MESLVLDRDELYKLTGYHKRSKQIEWLRREGIRFAVGADGYARVYRFQFQTAAPSDRATTPDVNALRLLVKPRRG